jgi:hypothetical protein
MSAIEQDREKDFASEQDGQPMTVLDQFQARRDELANEGPREHEMIIPDYQGNLRIVCKYPAGGSDVVVAAVQRVQSKRENEATLSANLDLIVNCCDRIEARLPGEDWKSLDSHDDRPLTFGPRLAALLNVNVEGVKSPGRLLARHLYSPASATGVFDGDVAAINQAGTLAQWLAKIEDETSEEFLGE